MIQSKEPARATQKKIELMKRNTLRVVVLKIGLFIENVMAPIVLVILVPLVATKQLLKCFVIVTRRRSKIGLRLLGGWGRGDGGEVL